MDKELHEICQLLNIEIIPEERNYWLIRTDAGKYFNDFINNNYISIGWDEFSNKDEFFNTDEKVFKEHISQKYPKEKKPGYIYNQIKRFMFEIKKGDMILIPSENSSQIAFGIVSQDFFVRDIKNYQDNPLSPKCFYKKCIKVEWKSKIFKDNSDPYLKMLMFTHTTISDANYYKDYINRILYNNYIIGDSIHSIFNVTSKENINANSLLNFLNLVTNKSIDVFNDVTNSNIEKGDIDIKLSVQSPGPIEFIGYSVGGILIVCALSILIFGIDTDIELFNVIKLHIKNEGLLNHILKFIQEANSNNQKTTELKNCFELSKKELKLKEKTSLLPISTTFEDNTIQNQYDTNTNPNISDTEN